MSKKVQEYITPLEAVNIASRVGVKITTPTIRNWCKQYPIAKKIGGEWYIIEEKLLKLLAGELDGRKEKETKKKS